MHARVDKGFARLNFYFAFPPDLIPQDQSSSARSSTDFRFEGMEWKGKTADATLAGPPSVSGGFLRLSLGKDWGRDLAAEEYGGAFTRCARPPQI